MIKINKEILYYLWFNNLKKINNDLKIQIIIENQITPYKFYNLNMKQYIELGFNIEAADYLEKTKDLTCYNEILEYIKKNNIYIISINDNNYPENLKTIKDPPIIIFVKGNLSKYSDMSIGIVGSRKATDYGKTIAYKISYELCKKGINVISGMARGIDTSAHEGAIDANGVTISILGSGFKQIYPPENKALMNKIITNGCVITEYLPDTLPLAMNFPYRNRLISALSKNILVIEAGERSGSLITANYALEQGKDVFAIPGNITSPMSKGSNKLLKDGAKIITSIEDILEEYNIDITTYDFNNLNDYEKMVVSVLNNNSLNIDDIIKYTNINIQNLMPILGKLECYNVVKRVYGGYYILR